MLRASHKGWRITYNANRPVTGAWRAEKHGVGMCAGDYDALLRMIDIREREGRR